MSYDPESLPRRPLTQVGLPLRFDASVMLSFRLAGLRLMAGQAQSADPVSGASLPYFDAPAPIDLVLRWGRCPGVCFAFVVVALPNNEIFGVLPRD